MTISIRCYGSETERRRHMSRFRLINIFKNYLPELSTKHFYSLLSQPEARNVQTPIVLGYDRENPRFKQTMHSRVYPTKTNTDGGRALVSALSD